MQGANLTLENKSSLTLDLVTELVNTNAANITFSVRDSSVLNLPNLTRVAILSNPDANPATWVASAVAAAPKFAVEVLAAQLRSSNEIEALMV